jgi:CheY-like chemotaxis protein/anti-sigma regulatory factor (Ser/Thr protein kinase)
MHVLIVDDQAVNRELCKAMLKSATETLSTFNDGEGLAEHLAQMESLPDVILMDVVMPKKDGFDAAKDIRAAYPDRHIPIIFLTALDDQSSFERCLILGDDFILKPVKRSVLVLKVQAHARISKMHNTMKDQHDKLESFQKSVEYDFMIAESIFNIFSEELTAHAEHIKGVNHLSTPMVLFNGDLMVFASRPHGGAYVLIADATGHGLSAAISTLPSARTFFSMAAKGMPVGEMVYELNREAERFLPAGMMLAASVFEIMSNGLDVSWWGGGLPDGFIVDESGNIERRLQSRHMPLGILEPDEFETDIVHLKLKPGQKIVCCTDGVVEAKNKHGEQFSEERVVEAIALPGDIIENIYQAVQNFVLDSVDDDVSLLTMEFPIVNNNPPVSLGQPASYSPIRSHSRLVFPAALLRQENTMPQIRRFLAGLVTGQHLDMMCSVLSELLANTIDHGLLQLDSSIKDEDGGFETFYQKRSTLLHHLDEHFEIYIDIDYDGSEQTVSFVLEHNGAGFDSCAAESQLESTVTHGRGMMLMESLCDSVTYQSEGRRVLMVYNFGSTL